MSKIWQIYGSDAHDMTLKLLEAADAVRLVPAGGSVALKPNLVVTGSPENGAVTHPGVVSGCLEYFQKHGVSDISVIESSWLGDDTMRVLRAAGIDKICAEYGVPFYDLKKDKARRVNTPAGAIDICGRALDAGLLVDLPVLKGHLQVRMTCALKNLKGCIPDREKRRFHALGLLEPIAALGAALRPGLIVVDSICGDLVFEEGGTPVQTNRMFLGTDAVQIDAYGRCLMGLMPEDVTYIEMAERYGAGRTEWLESDLVSLNEPADSQGYPAPRGTVAELTRGVHEDKACSACFASLVRALHLTKRRKIRDVYIGQGWQEKKLSGLGIGRCCRSAETCVMGCPPSAADIVRVLNEMAD